MRPTNPRILLLLPFQENEMRSWLKKHLEEYFAILDAHTVEEALFHLAHQAVQAVLTTYLISEMTAIHFCQSLRSQVKFAQLPVILLLEPDEMELVSEALSAGISNILPTPITPAHLLTGLKIAFKHKESLDLLTKHVKKFKRLAERDPLTHFYNRYVLYKEGKKQVSKACEEGLPLSILMIDIDRFKNINDLHGHLIGDEVLMEFSSLLAGTLRGNDITARFGGEEFVVLLPDTSPQQALIVAEKLRRIVAKHPFQTSQGPSHITISIGVTTLTTHGNSKNRLEHMMKEIDDALYEAKENGRNQVVFFEIEKEARLK